MSKRETSLQAVAEELTADRHGSEAAEEPDPGMSLPPRVAVIVGVACSARGTMKEKRATQNEEVRMTPPSAGEGAIAAQERERGAGEGGREQGTGAGRETRNGTRIAPRPATPRVTNEVPPRNVPAAAPGNPARVRRQTSRDVLELEDRDEKGEEKR